MTRNEKISALTEVWESRLFAAYGVYPRAVDKREYVRELKRTKDSQLDEMVRASNLDVQTHVW